MNTPELLTAFVTDLSTVVGALVDRPATIASAGTPAAARGWTVKIVVEGAASGAVTIAVSAEQAERLTQVITATGDVPPEAAVADTLFELCGQACGALGQDPRAAGLRFSVQTPAHVSYTPSGSILGLLITVGDVALTVGAWGSLDEPPASAATPPDPRNLEVILDIDLPITVRFGETDMSLLALSRLGPGSLIDLSRSPDEPVDVLANGRLIARGEVVSVAGNYGVRVLEVVSAGDRLRSLPAQG